MRAVLCKSFGPPESLVVEDLPRPVASKGRVVVAVHAASVNFPDLLVIQDKYQFKPKLPFTPGGEIAGVVVEVGEGVTQVAPGDHVVGWAPFGLFAEVVAMDEAQVVKVPAGIDMAVASTLLVAYGTTHHALIDRARLRAGETLVVLGATLFGQSLEDALNPRLRVGHLSVRRFKVRPLRGKLDAE